MTHQYGEPALASGNGASSPTPGDTREPAGHATEPFLAASGEGIPAAGRVIDNPISGEHIVIRESGAQTGGKLLAFDLFLPPGGHVPARHVHPAQEERFTVMAGLMRFQLGRRTVLAGPGETIVVPLGTAHWFGNAGEDTSHAYVEVRPALRMQELFETTEAIGTAGHLRGTRLPRLRDLARVLLEFQREVATPYVPAFLIKALLTPLALLARDHGRAGAGPSR